VRAGNISCDREAQTSPALVLVARFVEAVEGPEDVLPMRWGDPRAVVVDDDRHELGLADRRNANAVGVALGVGD
jgi:hypothetical protein